MRILFISPHTDDVELGAGGTLLRLLEENNEILWIVFSTAEDSLPYGLSKDTLKKEFLQVVKETGLKDDQYRIFNFKVRRLHEKRQEILEELVKTNKEFKPNLVIGPSLKDYHQDHQIVANEMVRAFKRDASIICYELPWNHISFDTQLFMILKKEHIERKISLLKNYKSQIALNRDYFSPDFIWGWARMRGLQVNAKYAEAFEVVRWIV